VIILERFQTIRILPRITKESVILQTTTLPRNLRNHNKSKTLKEPRITLWIRKTPGKLIHKKRKNTTATKNIPEIALLRFLLNMNSKKINEKREKILIV